MPRHLQTLHPVTCVLVLCACATLTFLGLREVAGTSAARTGQHQADPQPKAIQNLADDGKAGPAAEDEDAASRRTGTAKPHAAAADPLEAASRAARRRARRQLQALRHRKRFTVTKGRPRPVATGGAPPAATPPPKTTTAPAQGTTGTKAPTTTTTGPAPGTTAPKTPKTPKPAAGGTGGGTSTDAPAATGGSQAPG